MWRLDNAGDLHRKSDFTIYKEDNWVLLNKTVQSVPFSFKIIYNFENYFLVGIGGHFENILEWIFKIVIQRLNVLVLFLATEILLLILSKENCDFLTILNNLQSGIEILKPMKALY